MTREAWRALGWEPQFSTINPSTSGRDDGKWEVWDAESERICVCDDEPAARGIVAALTMFDRDVQEDA